MQSKKGVGKIDTITEFESQDIDDTSVEKSKAAFSSQRASMSVISTNIVHKSSENDQINTSNANGKPAPSSSQTLMKIGTYHDKGATFKKFKDEKVPSPKE